jgi:hypothetical protein
MNNSAEDGATALALFANSPAFIYGIVLISRYNDKKDDTKIDKQKKDTVLGVGIASLLSSIIAAICFQFKKGIFPIVCVFFSFVSIILFIAGLLVGDIK